MSWFSILKKDNPNEKITISEEVVNEDQVAQMYKWQDKFTYYPRRPPDEWTSKKRKKPTNMYSYDPLYVTAQYEGLTVGHSGYTLQNNGSFAVLSGTMVLPDFRSNASIGTKLREKRQQKIDHLPIIGGFSDNLSKGAWMRGFANMDYMINPTDEQLDNAFPKEVVDYHRQTYGERWAAKLPYKEG
jgi:hypothetical protein